jgi:hypothetical protein
MKREITKAEIVTDAHDNQTILVHYSGMYVTQYINLDNEEMELLQGIRSTTTGRNLLCKLFNVINQIEL